ncbi:uncharacterized protein LOC126845467 [Adelges cooleyi]|uniref:uncharacterized protein LOC126845467 n=1 Tax=Adelges cooleyi TaxID=133065 RepID=UPI00217F9774|nr:uncharacterized protein LOC126845467 [Adelges cooleyi]
MEKATSQPSRPVGKQGRRKKKKEEAAQVGQQRQSNESRSDKPNDTRGFFILLIYYTNSLGTAQHVECRKAKKQCKPHMLNGHYIQWPNQKMEEYYLQNKKFIPKNIIFTRFQICGNHVFLVSPRFKEGVPFTLSSVTLNGNDQCYNYVRPFPSLVMSDVGGQEAIVNAVDIYMGQDGILWVLDIGIVNTIEDRPIKENDPKVLGINFGNGRIIHTIPLRPLICRVRSRLQYIVVEYIGDNSPIIYVGDGGTRSIIVWNVDGKEGYKVKLPRTATISCTETGAEDMFYLVLIETPSCNYLYFTYLSSVDMFKVRTKDLRKRIHPKCIVNVGRKPCKMVIVGSAYGSVIYFRIKGMQNLYSWDTKESFLEENMMVVKKSVDCRTITHIDVDNDGVLWELESNIDDYMRNTVGCYGASIVLKPIFGKSEPLQPCLTE